MNIRYIHRWCSTDKSNGIAFVGVWSPTNVWAICPGSRSRPCGKLMNFFICCLFWLPSWLGSLQNRHNYIIYSLQQVQYIKKCIKLIQHYIIPSHLNITMKLKNQEVAHHSLRSLSSAPPPLVLSTTWANTSPTIALRGESKVSKA
jgi:hypothetical protein